MPVLPLLESASTKNAEPPDVANAARKLARVMLTSKVRLPHAEEAPLVLQATAKPSAKENLLGAEIEAPVAVCVAVGNVPFPPWTWKPAAVVLNVAGEIAVNVNEVAVPVKPKLNDEPLPLAPVLTKAQFGAKCTAIWVRLALFEFARTVIVLAELIPQPAPLQSSEVWTKVAAPATPGSKMAPARASTELIDARFIMTNPWLKT